MSKVIENILHILKELVSHNDRVLDLFSYFLRKCPRLSPARQTMSMRPEEWHHRTQLIPSNYDLIIARIPVESWDVASQQWKTDNSSREHLMHCDIEMVPITSNI